MSAEVLREFIDKTSKFIHSSVGISLLSDNSLVHSNSVVKVASSNGYLVYASRSSLPNHSISNQIEYYKHTGLYSFTREDILLFGNTMRGELERAENVEILRLIEQGIRVNSLVVENYGRSVDTEFDLQFVNTYGTFKDDD